MIGSEQHFRVTLGQPRAATVLDALAVADRRARLIAATEGFVAARTEPTVAFDLATGLLDVAFAATTGIRKAVVNEQVLWVIEDLYALRVKKLGPSYTPMNHSSGQQSAIRQHLPLAGLPSLIYVTAGILCSPLTGLPLEYVVVKHVAGRSRTLPVEWVVDLQDLAKGGTAPATPVLSPAAPAVPAAKVSRRRPASKPGIGKAP